MEDGRYVVQVQADNSGEWVGNGLTFDCADDARRYGHNLSQRWTAVKAFRVCDRETSEVVGGAILRP